MVTILNTQESALFSSLCLCVCVCVCVCPTYICYSVSESQSVSQSLSYFFYGPHDDDVCKKHNVQNSTKMTIFFLMKKWCKIGDNFSVFFFPVNIKSARERHFSEGVHGYIFGFTGTSFRKFTGKRFPSRALFWTFSRALFVVHGQQFFKYSRALFAVHGHFFSKSNKKKRN